MAAPFLNVSVLAVVLCALIGSSHQECCKDGWVSYHGDCYLFYDEQKYSWNGAGHFCASQRSELVEVSSKEQNDFLKSQAYKMFRSSGDRHHAYFWLGAADDLSEGSWVWYPSNRQVTFTDWATGQPSSVHNHDEDCLLFNGALNFTWNDEQCTLLGYPICKATGGSGSLVG